MVDQGKRISVFVDETRPLWQGARLTAWELMQRQIPATIICDSMAGYVMNSRPVSAVIVGADRITANGDVANKIGTYLKALAASDNRIPFYVGLPSPTIDFNLMDGRDIPIEERDAEEVATMTGLAGDGRIATVRVLPPGSPVANYAFDVTPARLVSGLITERGVLAATPEGLAAAFPERASRIRRAAE